MPRGDRTGPQGFGSMTGRGMGFCAGYDTPGYLNPGFGGQGMGGGMGFARGGGWGRGGGRGMAWGRGGGGRWNALPAYGQAYGYYPTYSPPSPEQERGIIEGELVGLKSQMEAMEKRLSEISEGEGKK